jgi:hypothetical protein
MSEVSLCDGEIVTLKDYARQGKQGDFEGKVLASERSGYVWVIVTELRMVFTLNIINIFLLDGKKNFYLYDSSQSIENVGKVWPPGSFYTDIFAFSENKETLISIVKTHKLLMS